MPNDEIPNDERSPAPTMTKTNRTVRHSELRQSSVISRRRVMSRFLLGFTLALIAAGPAVAAGPAGSYRLTAVFERGSFTALLSFAPVGNGWTGQFLGSLEPTEQNPPTVRDVQVAGDRFRFSLGLLGGPAMRFDGKLPAGAGPIPGSLTAGETIVPVTLEPSALAKFDRTGLLKEIAATAPPGPIFYAAVGELLTSATASKAPVADVKALADRAAKVAEAHGVRWQMHILLTMARALGSQPAYIAVALDLARRADKLLDPADEVGVQLAVLDLLKRLSTQANDTAALGPLEARIDALEARDYRDYRDYLAASPARPEPYPGRKAHSDRVALVELFTGADDPPSQAAELAFDALGRVFKPTEVVRLQYHLNDPDADPLATKVGAARWAYYRARLGGSAGIPAFYVNGRPGAPGGGPAEVAAIKLKQYRALIDPQLDTAPAAALQLTAQRTGEKVTITAKVSGLAKPAAAVRLRLAIAETLVRYRGGNGVRYHQCVVRGFAGPPDGAPLPRTAAQEQAVVDVAALRAALAADLDECQKKNPGVVFADRPLGLRSLVVVGFIQDDATHEVLQAAQAEVK
jgi:hypothetical protein